MERKTHTHTSTHTHQMDSSDNKGDCNPWQAELTSVPASDETRSVTLTDSPERKLAMEGARSREDLST